MTAHTRKTTKTKKQVNRLSAGHILVALFTGLFALVCLYPFLLVISGSFTTKEDAILYGFRLIPRHITTTAYKSLLINGTAILNGYKVTVFVTVVGTTLSLFINSLMGFVLSRRQMKFRRFINFYVLFTMLFNAGMVPWYIICVNILKIKDTIFALILPSLACPWYIFLIRNYFSSVPEELYESARLDGAGDFRVYRSIYMHIATPVLATVLLFTALGYWNDWYNAMLYMNDEAKYPLQYMLYSVQQQTQALARIAAQAGIQVANLPSNSLKMAMAVVATGPIIIVYPFVQKYFISGITIGSVKG